MFGFNLSSSRVSLFCMIRSWKSKASHASSRDSICVLLGVYWKLFGARCLLHYDGDFNIILEWKLFERISNWTTHFFNIRRPVSLWELSTAKPQCLKMYLKLYIWLYLFPFLPNTGLVFPLLLTTCQENRTAAYARASGFLKFSLRSFLWSIWFLWCAKVLKLDSLI